MIVGFIVAFLLTLAVLKILVVNESRRNFMMTGELNGAAYRMAGLAGLVGALIGAFV